MDFLKPFQERYKEFAGDMAQVEAILSKSEKEAQQIAQQTLNEVKTKMGL